MAYNEKSCVDECPFEYYADKSGENRCKPCNIDSCKLVINNLGIQCPGYTDICEKCAKPPGLLTNFYLVENKTKCSANRCPSSQFYDSGKD